MGISMIVFSLILLMFFAYRGYSIIFIAPIFAVIAAIGSGHASMPVYREIYMTKAAEYIKTYYPVFLLGAVFAKVMEQGGLAAAVADKIVSALGRDKAILAVLLGCGVLTYGGLSVFVVAFVMYPFAAILFKQADIPKRLLPGLLWMGIFTYSMVAIPGTPQIQNIIPTSFFGTSTWSAPVLGLIGVVLYFGLAWGWISYRHKKLKAKGEGYGHHVLNEPEESREALPDWRLSSLPLLLVIVLNLLISNPFHWDWAYHWDPESLDSFIPLHLSLLAGGVDKVQAIWSINAALIVSSIAAAVIGRRRLKLKGGLAKPINTGAIGSTTAILNVASGYAYGCVIAALPAFAIIKDALLGLHLGNGPLMSAIVTTGIMTGRHRFFFRRHDDCPRHARAGVAGLGAADWHERGCPAPHHLHGLGVHRYRAAVGRTRHIAGRLRPDASRVVLRRRDPDALEDARGLCLPRCLPDDRH